MLHPQMLADHQHDTLDTAQRCGLTALSTAESLTELWFSAGRRSLSGGAGWVLEPAGAAIPAPEVQVQTLGAAARACIGGFSRLVDIGDAYWRQCHRRIHDGLADIERQAAAVGAAAAASHPDGESPAADAAAGSAGEQPPASRKGGRRAVAQ